MYKDGSNCLSFDCLSDEPFEGISKKFARKAKLGQDIRCPFCEKTFVNKSNLNIHVRDKHGERSGPQVCYICFKQVKNLSCLRVHMNYRHRSNLSSHVLPQDDSKCINFY